MTPLGAFLTGSVAETFGVPAACAVGGGAGLIAVLVLAWAWLRHRAAYSG